MQNFQAKSHEVLLKVLNNVGIIGSILAAIVDIIFVIIMVFGIDIQADLNAIIIFAIVNALVGIMINILLRFQGQKYAEIENEDLCKRYYNKRIKEKKYMSMGLWMGLKTVQDFIIKGCLASFSIFGAIYITIQGSKNPIQILMTLATLILFACFGLMGMNSAYSRYYNIQVPYMELKLNEREIQKAMEMAQEERVKQGDSNIPDNSGTNILESSNSISNTGLNSESMVLDGNNNTNSVLGITSDTSDTAADSTDVCFEGAMEENKEQKA